MPEALFDSKYDMIFSLLFVSGNVASLFISLDKSPMGRSTSINLLIHFLNVNIITSFRDDYITNL